MATALSRRLKSKLGALIQLAVFLLLQLSLILPPLVLALGQRHGDVVCRQDHALCGCAPARIAAGTCCCAKASVTPSCCRVKVPTGVPAVTVLPCGKDDPVVLSTLDSFLPDKNQPLPVIFASCAFPVAVEEQPLEQCERPPLPPPRNLLRS